MRNNLQKLILTIWCGLTVSVSFCQVELPKPPTVSTFEIITPTLGLPSNNLPNPNIPNTRPNGMDIYEQDRKRIEQMQLSKRQMNSDIAQFNANRLKYNLPSYGNIASTKYYRKALNELNSLNPKEYSLKKATFIIENAYLEEKQEFAEFDKLIKQTGDFLREKMDELNYDPKSNLAKNFILFQFFSEPMELKSKDLEHLPFKYDFEDYMGVKDWSKMFVTKLLATGSGQCNSMPRLYLILAEEIGAEAFLSLSPNHSYIRFKDNRDYWYNVELTNGMFTANSFILQSGFIKSEALQNEIYMQEMTNEQLLSQLYVDFATGYTRKFGYDAFTKNVIDRALELYPNNINANLVNANFLTRRFEYASNQFGINPRDKNDLQKINYYPRLVEQLKETNQQYNKVDNLGYTYMSPEDYENWLGMLQDAKQKQDSEKLKEQFNIELNKPIKD